MKKRSISLIVIIAVLSIIMITNLALAGSAQHNRWKGVAIGLGAAIIGSAIYKQYKNQPSQAYSNQCPKYHRYGYHPHPPAYNRHGFWEIQKEWIPPTYKEVWNPGHYDDRGRWAEGHWIKIIDEPGYWVEKRVWIVNRAEKYRR